MSEAWKTIKKTADIKLDGVEVSLEMRDGALAAVTITDAKGQRLRVAYTSYSMQAYVPAEPAKEKRYEVRGDVVGVAINETFSDKYEAERRKLDIEDAAKASVEVVEVEADIPF